MIGGRLHATVLSVSDRAPNVGEATCVHFQLSGLLGDRALAEVVPVMGYPQGEPVQNARACVRPMFGAWLWPVCGTSCEVVALFADPLRVALVKSWSVDGGGAWPSENTPGWRVPADWWARLHAWAADLGLAVFHKTNLYVREQRFPGDNVQVVRRAPEAFFRQG